VLAAAGLTVSRCEDPGCEHPDHRPLRDRIHRDPPIRLSRPDPVVKYDGAGEPVRLSETGLNRAGRRALARQLRRERAGA
jgi:hypothetical protein